MKAVFINLSTVAVPIASTQNPPWVTKLDTGIPYTVDNTDHTVVTIGDEPTLREGVENMLTDLAEFFGKLLTFWKDHEATEHDADGDQVVRVRIANEGENALRVILGDPTNDVTLEAGAADDFTAPLYIEVRELGV